MEPSAEVHVIPIINSNADLLFTAALFNLVIPQCRQIKHITWLQCHSVRSTQVGELRRPNIRSIGIPCRKWRSCWWFIQFRLEHTSWATIHSSSNIRCCWEDLFVHAWRFDWGKKYEVFLPYNLNVDVLIGISMQSSSAVRVAHPEINGIWLLLQCNASEWDGCWDICKESSVLASKVIVLRLSITNRVQFSRCCPSTLSSPYTLINRYKRFHFFQRLHED